MSFVFLRIVVLYTILVKISSTLTLLVGAGLRTFSCIVQCTI